MTYFDKYPNCINCPVDKYCGTAVSSIRLCQSYNDSIAEKEKSHILTLSKATPIKDETDERIVMWDNITD